MQVPPAPKVDPATATAAIPTESPIVEEAPSSPLSQSYVVEQPLTSSYVVADPPLDASLPVVDALDKKRDNNNSSGNNNNDGGQEEKLDKSANKNNPQIIYAAHAALIIGPVPKTLCERLVKCIYIERSYLSYGEVRRYIVLHKNTHELLVYTDVNGALLYTLPLKGLDILIEDRTNPNFYSYTISPEANNGGVLSGAWKSDGTRGSLDSLLLVDERGDIRYQLAFENGDGEKRLDEFVRAVNDCCAVGNE